MIHDVGAGGLSNALPELVKDAGFGGKFELRQVESADRSLSPLQICKILRTFPFPPPPAYHYVLYPNSRGYHLIILDLGLLNWRDC